MTLSVHSGQAAVAIALADEQPTLNASVAVVNEIGTSVQHADLVIAPAHPSEPSDVPIIAVNTREIIRLKFDSNEVRVQGGRLQMGETEAN